MSTTWQEYFSDICKIPHISKHEAALCAYLKHKALDAGLRVETDAKGNLRIDRQAAKGFEKRACTILQAHMDMVPQVAPGVTFDFLTDPVPWQIDGDWLNTGGKTTLGADNGIAVALIMQLLTDPQLHCGPLRAIFTVEEEIGLDGAAAVSSAWLDAARLINLDAEDDRSFFIGCAGGMRFGGEIVMPLTAPEAADQGFQITVSGLPGGHSGVDIDKKRGNANRILLQILAANPDFHVAKLDGGTVDNAIPRECRVVGATCRMPETTEIFEQCREELGENGKLLSIEVAPCPCPREVWQAEAQRKLVAALLHLPDGVIKMSALYPGVVETSANLAVLHTPAPGKLIVHTSQRSLLDAERQKATETVRLALEPLGMHCTGDNHYCAWTPRQHAELTDRAIDTYEQLFGTRPNCAIMHAGLETGHFAARKPELQLLAAGPIMENPHSPAERVSIASTERILQWLQALLPQL